MEGEETKERRSNEVEEEGDKGDGDVTKETSTRCVRQRGGRRNLVSISAKQRPAVRIAGRRRRIGGCPGQRAAKLGGLAHAGRPDHTGHSVPRPGRGWKAGRGQCCTGWDGANLVAVSYVGTVLQCGG